MPLLLPSTPTEEDLLEIKDYLEFHKKIRDEAQTINKSGDRFVYLAFAEEPFSLNNRAK